MLTPVVHNWRDSAETPFQNLDFSIFFHLRCYRPDLWGSLDPFVHLDYGEYSILHSNGFNCIHGRIGFRKFRRWKNYRPGIQSTCGLCPSRSRYWNLLSATSFFDRPRFSYIPMDLSQSRKFLHTDKFGAVFCLLRFINYSSHIYGRHSSCS